MPDTISHSNSMANAVDLAIQTQGRFEDTAEKVGEHMNTAEYVLATAFSLSPSEKSSQRMYDIANKLGLSKEKADEMGVQGLQLFAQNFYQRVERAAGILQQLIMSSHQQMMSIIRNIGR